MRAIPATLDHLLAAYQPNGPVRGRLLGAASTTPETVPPAGTSHATGARCDTPTVRGTLISPAPIGIPASKAPEPRKLGDEADDGDGPERGSWAQTMRHPQGASSSIRVPMATTGTTALSPAQEAQREDQGPLPQATVPETSNTPRTADQQRAQDAELIAFLRDRVAAQDEILARQQASLDKRVELAR